jgi:hypothetical protein
VCFSVSGGHSGWLACAEHEVRNGFIVAQIAEILSAYDHVLVVFGGSHLLSQRPALEAMLGKPVTISTAVP